MKGSEEKYRPRKSFLFVAKLIWDAILALLPISKFRVCFKFSHPEISFPDLIETTQYTTFVEFNDWENGTILKR
jgi:hypothetical protein